MHFLKQLDKIVKNVLNFKQFHENSNKTENSMKIKKKKCIKTQLLKFLTISPNLLLLREKSWE